MTLWNKCVQAAFILDKAYPGWHKKIDLEKLDMNSCGHCIFGQLFSVQDMDYQRAKAEELGISSEAIGWQMELRDEHWESINKRITDYWKTLISKRIQNETI